MENSTLTVLMALLLALAGCSGIGSPATTPQQTPTPETTTSTTTNPTSSSVDSPQLVLNARNLTPTNVSIRIARYSTPDSPLVNETVPMAAYELRDYTDHLADGETYEVIVKTPTDTQRHVLRPNQSLRFIIKDTGTIEREMNVD